MKFGRENPSEMSSIEDFYEVLRHKSVDWQTPLDVVETFGVSRVDTLSNRRVCIDIGGNNIRVVLLVNYGQGSVLVRFIGWHKDYDEIEDIHNI